jgi:predicted transglutaminase-like cysteine proteinase
MILLTSLLYCLLFYLFPGVLLVEALAYLLDGAWGLSASTWFLLFHAVAYLGLLAIVRAAGWAVHDLDLGASRRLRVAREWLRNGNNDWLRLVEVLLLGAGILWMARYGLLPLQIVPLVGASLAGLLVQGSLPLKLDGLLDLPSARFASLGQVPEPAACTEHCIAWRFVVDGQADRVLSFNESYVIQRDAYRAARELPRFPRTPLNQYLRYLTDQRSSDVRALANQLRLLSQANEFTAIQEVENVVEMVRAIPYASDEETHQEQDHAQFPIETLVELRGDCEDHAILAAALLFELGHQVGLFCLDLDDSAHMALAYHAPGLQSTFGALGPDSRWYHYVETVPGAENDRIGAIGGNFVTHLRGASIVTLST